MPPSKKETIAALVVEMLFEYRNNVHSILTDNGGEFADFKYIERFLKTNVFFADPYSSWQKEAVEYANKLYRQYIPKGMGFENFSDDDILQIQNKINRRPREKLNFISPLEAFYKQIIA